MNEKKKFKLKLFFIVKDKTSIEDKKIKIIFVKKKLNSSLFFVNMRLFLFYNFIL